MEYIAAHILKYPIIYSITLICLLIVFVYLDRIKIIYNILFKPGFNKEGFQSDENGSTDSVATNMIEKTCNFLKEGIKNHELVKMTHKDIHVENLDENLEKMKEYFVSYKCE